MQAFTERLRDLSREAAYVRASMLQAGLMPEFSARPLPSASPKAKSVSFAGLPPTVADEMSKAVKNTNLSREVDRLKEKVADLTGQLHRNRSPTPERRPLYNRNVSQDGKPKCFNCNRFGHIARFCRDPPRQRNGPRPYFQQAGQPGMYPSALPTMATALPGPPIQYRQVAAPAQGAQTARQAGDARVAPQFFANVQSVNGPSGPQYFTTLDPTSTTYATEWVPVVGNPEN